MVICPALGQAEQRGSEQDHPGQNARQLGHGGARVLGGHEKGGGSGREGDHIAHGVELLAAATRPPPRGGGAIQHVEEGACGQQRPARNERGSVQLDGVTARTQKAGSYEDDAQAAKPVGDRQQVCEGDPRATVSFSPARNPDLTHGVLPPTWSPQNRIAPFPSTRRAPYLTWPRAPGWRRHEIIAPAPSS